MPSPTPSRGPQPGARLGRLVRSRRPAAPQPAVRADHGLWTVDRAVRVLAAACRDAGREVPLAHAVVIGADIVWIHLGTPDERAPDGWYTDRDGRTWSADLRRLQNAVIPEQLAEPFPRLVALGDNARGSVLVDIGHAGGIIGLEGDRRQARILAHDWARDLATSPWSRGVRVIRVGFPPPGPQTSGALEVRTLAEAGAALSDGGGGVLLLSGLPGGRDREEVYRLADDPLGRWTVVVVGRVEHPRWRFAVDAAGVVDTGLLAEPVVHRPGPASDLPVVEGDDEADDGMPALIPPTGAGSPPGPPDRGRRTIYAASAGAVALVAALVLVLSLGLGGGSAHQSVAAAVSSTSATKPSSHKTRTPAPSTATSSAVSGTPKSALLNPATHQCLSGAAGTDGTPLTLAPCDGHPNQQWTVGPDGTLRTKGLCMDAAWGATAPGTVVQIANCSGNPAQHFVLQNDTVFSMTANLCAGAGAGEEIRLTPCNGGDPVVFHMT